MPLIAIDIGNSRVKLGRFDSPPNATGLPMPGRTLTLPADKWDEQSLQTWLADEPVETQYWIASVNRAAQQRLVDGLTKGAWQRSATGELLNLRILSHDDLPIQVVLPRPEHVGIDRLAGAVAANRLRDPTRPAVVAHVGTAITVNLVTADGVFRGGAIAPGIGISARALGQFTDLLPHHPLEELTDAVPALGTNTLEAIHSGLYWGAVGTMRELIARLGEPLDAKPEVFLTGGAAPSVAATLDPAARYFEHLVLSGIALASG